jgi:transcriptional regulator with XRE-family HTH domain
VERQDLTKWRKRYRLTQKQLADFLGVRNMTVYRWESGMRAIPSMLPWALKGLERELEQEGK